MIGRLFWLFRLGVMCVAYTFVGHVILWAVTTAGVDVSLPSWLIPAAALVLAWRRA